MRLGILVGCALALLAVGGAGAGTVDQLPPPPSSGGSAPAASSLRPCSGPLPWAGAKVIKSKTPKPEPLCGSRHADVFFPGRGDTVWGHQGADFVRARNGAPNEVWGGPGKDVANLDSCDTAHGIEAPNQSGKPCPVVVTRRMFALATVYPFTAPRLECERDAGARPLIRFAAYPLVRAVDVSARVDWQNVAWSALLFQQVDGRWKLVSQTPWFWDRTYDRQVTLQQPNAWRAVRTRTKPPAELVPETNGPFRVAVRYHWYAARGLSAHDETAWVRQHGGSFAGPRDLWCDFSE